MMEAAPQRIRQLSKDKMPKEVCAVNSARMAKHASRVRSVGGVTMSFSGKIVIAQRLVKSTFPDGPIAVASKVVDPSEMGTTLFVLGFH